MKVYLPMALLCAAVAVAEDLPKLQEIAAKDAPQFEHLKWKAGVKFGWSVPEGKGAKKLYVSLPDGKWTAWGPETAPGFLEEITSDEAALEIAFRFYPGWGQLVTELQWRATQDLCRDLGIASVDKPQGLQWIEKKGPESFEAKVVHEEDGYRVTYVAWSWRVITTYEVRVKRDGATKVLSTHEHMDVGHPETGQVMAGEHEETPEERVSWAFLDGIKKIFRGSESPTKR